MDIFRKVVDDEGNETYEVVALNDVDIREHPNYKDVLTETVERRKEIKALKDQLKGQPAEPVEPEKTSAPKTEAQESSRVEALEAMVAALTDRIESLPTQLRKSQQEELEQHRERDTRLQQLIKDNGLSSLDLPLLENSTNPEETARVLSQRLLQSGVHLTQNDPYNPTNIAQSLRSRFQLDKE